MDVLLYLVLSAAIVAGLIYVPLELRRRRRERQHFAEVFEAIVKQLRKGPR